jgi:hypothetical protein
LPVAPSVQVVWNIAGHQIARRAETRLRCSQEFSVRRVKVNALLSPWGRLHPVR